jgi:ABC-type amino acid transport substrate-binding protein
MSVTRRFPRLLSSLVMLVAGLLLPAVASAQTLDKVKARGSVVCGVNPGLLGFSARDAQGNWTGFDIDLCRALAAAIFDDPKKVQFTPLTTTERPFAQYNLDLVARSGAEITFRGRHLLRRPRIPRPTQQERDIGPRTRRLGGMRSKRHNQRVEFRRLFSRQ